MGNFICGILYFYENKSEYSNLFDSDGTLTFRQTDAVSDKIVKKVKWSKVDRKNKKIEFDFVNALSDFYTAGDGDLSSMPLFNDPEFQENNFFIKFVWIFCTLIEINYIDAVF